jgi:hypothetical protein
MADSDERPPRLGGNTSGAASRRSRASHSSSPAPLTRLVSGNYLDDQSQYQGHRYHEEHEEAVEHDEDSSDETDLTEKDTQDTEEDLQGSRESIVPEVRDGIEDQRDVEAGPKLEKSRTSKSGRSTRDPNLVTWDGPEDPKNPKNWRWQQKWAATFVGEQTLFILPENKTNS